MDADRFPPLAGGIINTAHQKSSQSKNRQHDTTTAGQPGQYGRAKIPRQHSACWSDAERRR